MIETEECELRMVSKDDLLVMLRRVEIGDPPALVFEEFWADSSPVYLASEQT